MENKGKLILIPHIIDHEKNMGFLDLDQSVIGLLFYIIIIANATRIGNWIHLNSKGILVGIMGILGMRTSSSLNFPLSIVAWITLIISFFLSPNEFHWIVLVGLGFEASWPLSQQPSAVSWAVAIHAHPRSLKIQMDSWWLRLHLLQSIDLNECRVPTIWFWITRLKRQ